MMHKFKRFQVKAPEIYPQVYCARTTIDDTNMLPEEERFTTVVFTKCIEQMNDPTIFNTYVYSNTRGFIDGMDVG